MTPQPLAYSSRAFPWTATVVNQSKLDSEYRRLEKVYEFSVSIESSRYHMMWATDESELSLVLLFFKTWCLQCALQVADVELTLTSEGECEHTIATTLVFSSGSLASSLVL